MASATPAAPTNKAASSLAWIAYTDSDFGYVVAADFSDGLGHIGAAANGPWTLVWGPAFNDGIVSYAARGQDGTLAVAFRGTNPAFVTGVWTNFVAHANTSLVTWQFPQSLKAKITAGTNAALALAIASTDPNSGQTLLQYLCESLTANPTHVLVTGHSLGGALANVAALWLYDQLPRYNVTATIYPMTFAAPTISDQTFQTAFNTAFPGYTPMVNTNDVVPMAWNNITGIQKSFTGPTNAGQTYPTLLDYDWALYYVLETLWLAQGDYYPLGAADTFTVDPVPVNAQSYPSWPEEVVLMHSMQDVYYYNVWGVSAPPLNHATTLIAAGMMPQASDETTLVMLPTRRGGARPPSPGHAPA